MGRPTVVVYVKARPTTVVAQESRVGFVVSKAVGGAVVRNRVKRRLRALSRPLVMGMPPGYDVVVRGLPAASGACAGVALDLPAAWAGASRRAGVK
jgi:ribonuclease P protein component